MSAVAISFSGRSCSVASTRSAMPSTAATLTGRFSHAFSSPRNQLLPIEPLAGAVLLHHHVRDLVDPLVAGEPLAAFEALAAPADHFAFLLSRESTTLSPRWAQ